MFVRGVRDRAEHHSLIEPEQVGRAQDDANHTPGGPGLVHLKDAAEDGELADEAVEQRHAERTQGNDHVNGGEAGHGCREPAKLSDQTGVAPLIEDADNQEERPSGDAVVDLLDDAAGEPHRSERKEAQGAEAQVADRAIGNQLLHVLLHHADQGAVDDGNDRKRHHDTDDPLPRHPTLRHQRQRKSNKPVSAHLQQHARQDD